MDNNEQGQQPQSQPQPRPHQWGAPSPSTSSFPGPGQLNTPPFGSAPVGGRPESGGNFGADFPAPPNVPPAAAYAPKKTKPRALILLAAASLSAVIGAGAGIGSYAAATAGDSTNSPIGVSTLPAAASPKLDGTISAAAEKISKSVVTINVRTARGMVGGTGVILDKDGHILTNDHVVADAGQNGTIQVTLSDGSVVDATLVGTSPNNDLAVIKIDGGDGLVPATFASSGTVKVGQAVVAVGSPLGLSESVTSGIVSNTARPVRSGDSGEAVYMAVQTDAAINHGNSGGPLVDLNGAVVGINSAIATGSNDSQSGSIGIGFAIPADVATRVAAELIKDGHSTDASLGVTVAGAGAQPGAQEEDPSGVPLQEVASGSAADQAGLQAGDRVTKINDISTTTADGLIAAIRFYAPGTQIEITYQRGGQTHTTNVTLDSAQ